MNYLLNNSVSTFTLLIINILLIFNYSLVINKHCVQWVVSYPGILIINEYINNKSHFYFLKNYLITFISLI